MARWPALAFAILAAAPALGADDAFERTVRPLLAARCRRCHGPDKASGGLRLDSREAILEGGDSGPAAVAGRPDASLLIEAVEHRDVLRMPPKEALEPAEVAALRDWIARGLPWPDGPEAGPTADAPGPATDARDWWSFRPVRDPEPPPVRDRDWPRSPIDRFILARLEAEGLAPAPPADRRTLIRRATYDLTGLPPAPEDVEAFAADPAPDAFDRLVGRLLASPAYGERWGRHWLDLARYADTAGENTDHPAPHAWRYRNWVIDAFNRDLPYDEFVRMQVAGDLIAADGPPARRDEGVVATGFLAVARRFGHDIDKDMHLTHEDVIDTMGRTFLGLSIACARCHDHKYDPITARDYYALSGILRSTRFPFPGCEPQPRPRDLVPLGAEGAWAYAVAEGAEADSPIHLRGDPAKPGPVVPRRWLEVLGGQAVEPGGGSGRRELAGWLAAPDNPLAARVMANRIWQHHFGRGIVGTPSDFGTRGLPPTHPELLDWLASRFVEDGWSVKALHRRVLLSATYRQASDAGPDALATDPDDALLGRFARRRLDAEEVRDSLLAAGGSLDRSPGGPHPFPPEDTWAFTQHNPFNAVYETDRRSVYLVALRNRRHPFLGLFDGADPNATTPERQATTVPTQALYFLNDPFFHRQSERLADRALAASGDDAGRLDALYRIALQRPPRGPDRATAAAFLARYAAELADLPPEERARAAWSALARAVLASNEFLYLD
jgi:hypothetical protein